MALRFIIVILSIFSLTIQTNAANCFVPAPEFPTEFLDAFLVNSPFPAPRKSAPAVLPALQAVDSPAPVSKPVGKRAPILPPQRALPISRPISSSLPGAKANMGTYFVAEPGFSQELLASLIANSSPSSPIAALKMFSPSLLSGLTPALDGPSPPALKPTLSPALATSIDFARPPPTNTLPARDPKVPTIAPGPAQALLKSLPPGVVKALEDLISYLPAYQSPNLIIAPGAPSAAPSVPIPVSRVAIPEASPASVVDATPPVACPPACGDDLNPALRNIAIKSEVCPCCSCSSCSCARS